VLFDLTSPGRRRVVRVVFGALAAVFAISFVFLGVGTGGGGFSFSDLFGGGGSSNPSSAFDDQIKAADARLAANPNDTVALGQLVQFHYSAGSQDVDSNQQLTSDGEQHLREAADAWNKYVKLSTGKIPQGTATYALTTFDQLNDRPRRAQVLTSIGLLDREDGRLDSALSNLNAALVLCDQTQNKSCRASALSNLASVYEARLELDHAFSLLQEALDLRREIKERSGEARIRRAMGELLLQKGQLADAQARFTEALTIETQLVEPVEVGVTLLAMARLENARGAPGRALALAAQAEEKFSRADRKLELVQTYNLRADAYLSSGQPFLALESSDKASDLLADIRVSDTSTLDVRDTYLSTLIAEARIEAATGNATSARAKLAAEIAAWKGPSSMMQLEALLQLGLLETSSGIPGGEERIARVRAEAESRHLGLLEKKAEASPR